METKEFTSSAKFLQWARMVVNHKLQQYDRAPVGKQFWTYGDGHVVERELGARGGTLLSSLGFMIKIAEGKFEHKADAQLIEWIDARGGITLAIDWGEQS